MYSHNLDPVAFKIFSLSIHWYSLAYLFGFLIGLYYSKYLIKVGYINLRYTEVEEFISWAVVAVIIGGRLGYIIFYNLEFYIQNPSYIIKIWQGGMSFHGGLIGLIISIFFYSKKNKINFNELANVVTSCAPIGIFLGRIANFVNAELIGKPTNSEWGVLFPTSEVPRHPSQLYEALFEGLFIFFLINWLYKNKFHKKINIYAVFLLVYPFFRFLIEFVREPDNHLGYVVFDLSMGQVLCIPMFLMGLILLKYKNG